MNYAEYYKTDPYLIRALLKGYLSQGLVQVRFKKVNGELRDMKCTINPTLIPVSCLRPARFDS